MRSELHGLVLRRNNEALVGGSHGVIATSESTAATSEATSIATSEATTATSAAAATSVASGTSLLTSELLKDVRVSDEG